MRFFFPLVMQPVISHHFTATDVMPADDYVFIITTGQCNNDTVGGKRTGFLHWDVPTKLCALSVKHQKRE